jgi:hypothetical protein
MNKTHLDIWSKQIIKKTNFKPKKEIKRAEYYAFGKTRVLIFTGQYKNKPAVLKIYDDPRISEEPLAQIKFNQQNKSKILRAPEVYKHEIASPQKGWLIMEKIPETAISFKRPLKPEQRKEFLEIYLEYRKNFPIKANRPLNLSENLPADKFHLFRIARWFQLANDKEAEIIISGQKPVLDPKEFIPRYIKGLSLIEKEFKKRKMIWSHGLFNPTKIFKDKSQNKYYLIDFGHNKMYPEGYELAFIIWADWFLETDWRMKYSDWKNGIDQWLLELKPIAKELKLRNFQSLIKVGLVERCLGTILADICATDRLRKEKEKRIALLYRFLDKLL